MLAAVDVDYRARGAVAACVVFRTWRDGQPTAEWCETVREVADYTPGEFYRRELPCLLRVLSRAPGGLAAVLVDGYVWLGPGRPGLGAHLHAALGGQIAVVGVAKTPFHGADAREVLRGGSARPLHVSAIGLDPAVAAEGVAAMAGAHRIPAMLRRVDRLCRDAPGPL